MKHLVVSAVNLVDGGTLEILRQCLKVAAELPGWRITAIVFSAEKVGVPGIEYIERPDIKPSWLRRVRFEYFECRQIAERLAPDFWLSLHDTTPHLGRLSGRTPQAVYCHNSMCFYAMSLREIWLDPKLLIFASVYSFFYRINLKKNTFIVVQQHWIRDAFRRQFDCSNQVIVAHPQAASPNCLARTRSGCRFFYPSFPRVFKNFEAVLEAWKILCEDPEWQGELTVTIDQHSNRYGRSLIQRYGYLRNVKFIGKISPSDVMLNYARNDCLVFPSKLETWGLPLTEAKQAGLSILAADLPYAHETIGNYDSAAFFHVDDSVRLAQMMSLFQRGELQFQKPNSVQLDAPFAENWAALFEQLLFSSKGMER